MAENKKPVRKNDVTLLSKSYKLDNGTVVSSLQLNGYELHGSDRSGAPTVAKLVEIRVGKRKFVEEINQYALVDSFVTINAEKFDDLRQYFLSAK